MAEKRQKVMAVLYINLDCSLFHLSPFYSLHLTNVFYYSYFKALPTEFQRISVYYLVMDRIGSGFFSLGCTTDMVFPCDHWLVTKSGDPPKTESLGIAEK
jgi:hypothetical protein